MNYILGADGLRENDMIPEHLFWSVFDKTYKGELDIPSIEMRAMIAHPKILFLAEELRYKDISTIPIKKLLPFDLGQFSSSKVVTEQGVYLLVNRISYVPSRPFFSSFHVNSWTIDEQYIESLFRKMILDEMLETL